MTPRIAVLMPAYNERDLASTVHGLRNAAAGVVDVTLVLVDDGSEPPLLLEELPTSTDSFRIVAARHPINLGQGAALETARQIVLVEPSIVAYVTMDADGQHRPSDALELANAIQRGADVAFGNRFVGDSNVPAARHVLLRAARLFEWTVTGLALADAHNGLRGFSRRALERIPIRQNRMAHATEIKQLVSRARPLVVVEIPVSVRYTRETLAKGQRSIGAIAIVRDLASRFLFGEP